MRCCAGPVQDQIPPRKRVIDHARYTAPTLQHEQHELRRSYIRNPSAVKHPHHEAEIDDLDHHHLSEVERFENIEILNFNVSCPTHFFTPSRGIPVFHTKVPDIADTEREAPAHRTLKSYEYPVYFSVYTSAVPVAGIRSTRTIVVSSLILVRYPSLITNGNNACVFASDNLVCFAPAYQTSCTHKKSEEYPPNHDRSFSPRW